MRALWTALAISLASSGVAFAKSPTEKVVLEYLQSQNQKPEALSESIYKWTTAGSNGQYNMYVQFREQQEQVVFYAQLMDKVPAERRKDAMLFITMANYGMVLGNFEMDVNDGEVRFKTSADHEGSTFTATQAKNYTVATLVTIDRYATGLKQVIFGGASPAEAIAAIEN